MSDVFYKSDKRLKHENEIIYFKRNYNQGHISCSEDHYYNAWQVLSKLDPILQTNQTFHDGNTFGMEPANGICYCNIVQGVQAWRRCNVYYNINHYNI